MQNAPAARPAIFDPDPFEGVDVYRYWRAQLKGTDAIGIPSGIGGVMGDPQPGLYKTRVSKGGPFEGVKFWLTDATGEAVHKWTRGLTVIALRGKDRTVEGEKAIDLWGWCLANPVSQADYKQWMETGSWPGEVVAPVAQSAPAATSSDTAMGSNSKQFGVGFEGLCAELDDYHSTCGDFLIKHATGIKTKAEADMASNMADLMGTVKGGIAKRLDDARSAEVRPHLDAQTEINGRYKPHIKIAQDTAEKLRGLATVFGVAEQRRLQDIANAEAAKKAAELQAIRDKEMASARAKAEADRKIAQDQADAMAAQLGEAAPTIDAEPIMEPPAPIVVVAPTVRLQFGGQRGSKRSIKTKQIADVIDHALALAHFADYEDIREAVAALAQKAVNGGFKVPGVNVREEVKL